MNEQHIAKVSGKKFGQRVGSRILEEEIQQLIRQGFRDLNIKAYGQHGIGGRLWRAGNDTVNITIDGQPGQRVGSFGFPNTVIEVNGPASDDVGWLNAGAQIVIHGNAGNGVANAMAQGRIYVAGNIGARGMTMTKHNPRFDPPELWVLGSVGDYFGEFMAGGISVICGHQAQNPDNVLGYRPFVGMVSGRVFFRGPHGGFSQPDAKLIPIDEEDWRWLAQNLKLFLQRIHRQELYGSLLDQNQWQLLRARTPQEKVGNQLPSMNAFREKVWDKELGPGGLIGDLSQMDHSVIPIITTDKLRRFIPIWENRKYAAPCEASCPAGIPVPERWRLIREGRVDEAVDMALSYTPFPATICGYLCPNLCMQACTRQYALMTPVDVAKIGQASIKASLPELPPESGNTVAVIGGGPAGISVAWLLRQKGHRAIVYDMAKGLGGKMTAVIPRSRLPESVVAGELKRIQEVIPHVYLQQKLTRKDLMQLRGEFDFVIVAVGAQKPVQLSIPGNERLMPALDFLRRSKANRIKPGKRVVIIGAGNVGCDVAAEAHRLGATEITLIDIQRPASFGPEREAAEAVGAKFLWPRSVKAVTVEGLELTSGEIIPADSVVISIGDAPDIDFLPEDISIENGFIVVNENYQTTDAKIFAIGDAVKPGLLADAIGSGRKVATTISQMLEGKRPAADARPMIDRHRVTLEYFDPRISDYNDLESCGSQCSSCGACRDCGICVTLCPQTAIHRREDEQLPDGYEYIVDEARCIGCGFCAGACPCGIWDLVENDALE
ncbi:MAG: FAD-dependent oxidoreductase [Desulfobacterales bacterium]|jgi:NADPH-dependent glutamate synthase beta subunit-like oxidoreductase/glutamate synthase domain-containing protein 3/NAD-dependent dihydropyrimidine dehydrogenase PreA subunit